MSFACAARKLAAVSATSGSSDAWLYRFGHALPNGPLAALGVVHGTDLLYLFGRFEQVGTTPAAADLELSARVQDAWGALARTGRPVTWPAFSLTGAFLTWNTPLTTETVWRAGRCSRLEEWGLLPE